MQHLGKFLFWIGVPLSVLGFLWQADLSGEAWLAPAVAWLAMGLGLGGAWVWLTHTATVWQLPTQGSFLLAAMVGNTGYLGYPVALLILGPRYFSWSLFYDMLGTLLGSYGLGVYVAARFGRPAGGRWQPLQHVVINPTLWAFALGLALHGLERPAGVDWALGGWAWVAVGLSLVLMGMRLSHLQPKGSWRPAWVSLGIKMLGVPLLMGVVLSWIGLATQPRLALVLQSAMPPALATLVLAEAYDLDQDLTVLTQVLGLGLLLATLPLWITLFGA